MLEIQNISKYYKNQQVLKNVSFVAEDGKVTGFVGPNSSGKSTTLYCALEFIKANGGRALFDGVTYKKLNSPIETVGTVLDLENDYKNTTAIKNLLFFARYCKIPRNRVSEIMNIAGIASIQNMKIKEMSTGMRKRLEIATAVLADPHNLILDNPFHGLDVEGVKWMRKICRYYAERGGAVLISTNNINELSTVADDLVIIANGMILQKTSVKDFLSAYSKNAVRVITPEPEKLLDIMQSQYSECSIIRVNHKNEDVQEGAAFVISNTNITDLAQLFNDKQLLTYQLSKECVSLEDAYMATIDNVAKYVSAPIYVYKNAPELQNLMVTYSQEQINNINNKATQMNPVQQIPETQEESKVTPNPEAQTISTPQVTFEPEVNSEPEPTPEPEEKTKPEVNATKETSQNGLSTQELQQPVQPKQEPQQYLQTQYVQAQYNQRQQVQYDQQYGQQYSQPQYSQPQYYAQQYNQQYGQQYSQSQYSQPQYYAQPYGQQQYSQNQYVNPQYDKNKQNNQDNHGETR